MSCRRDRVVLFLKGKGNTRVVPFLEAVIFHYVINSLVAKKQEGT
jgi:hypothetical protein